MYSFSRDGGTLYIDHFMDCESDVVLKGRTYHVKMSTRYPDGGHVRFDISPAPDFKVVARLHRTLQGAPARRAARLHLPCAA